MMTKLSFLICRFKLSPLKFFGVVSLFNLSGTRTVMVLAASEMAIADHHPIRPPNRRFVLFMG
uniref:Uncharacterized protein n=1 Tax=Helianthus annuus TaxID=4232 RepID=A0A251UZ12_HELAN